MINYVLHIMVNLPKINKIYCGGVLTLFPSKFPFSGGVYFLGPLPVDHYHIIQSLVLLWETQMFKFP